MQSSRVQLVRRGCLPFLHKSLKRYINSGRILAFCRASRAHPWVPKAAATGYKS